MAKQKAEKPIDNEDEKLPGAEESGQPPRPNQPEGHNISPSQDDGRDPPKNTDVNKGGEHASDVGASMVGFTDPHAESFRNGYRAAEAGFKESAAYRQQVGMDVFCSLVHGCRIQVKDSEEPSATAERLIRVHSELMIKAAQAGIIPAAEEQKAAG